MADEFALTGRPVRVTGTGVQPLEYALDVSDYDEMDAQLLVLGLDGATPSVTVRLLTSMCNKNENGWEVVGTYSAKTTANAWQTINVKGFLKYVRWEVSAFAGNAATFAIRGMLREWS